MEPFQLIALMAAILEAGDRADYTAQSQTAADNWVGDVLGTAESYASRAADLVIAAHQEVARRGKEEIAKRQAAGEPF